MAAATSAAFNVNPATIQLVIGDAILGQCVSLRRATPNGEPAA
jgi:hypothetical protein